MWDLRSDQNRQFLYFLQKEIVCEELTGQRNQAKLCLGASNSKEF